MVRFSVIRKEGTNNMNDNRDFKGVWIPKEVWLDNRLNALEKVILMEIDSLDQGEKGCYASNEHLAEFCQCSKTKVSTAVSKLIECGYLYIQNFDGRKRELKSRLSNFERQDIKKCNADIQNLKESNTDNNTDNNTDIKASKKEEKRTTYDEIIKRYTGNEELESSLIEFVKMRKMLKKPLTNGALKMALNKLDRLSTNDSEKIEIVNQSVMNSWLGFYELKKAHTNKTVNSKPNTDEIDYSLPEEYANLFK